MRSAVLSRTAAPAVALPTSAGAVALLGMACRAMAQQAQPAVEAAPSGVVALVGSLAQRLPGLWGSLPGVMVALGAVLMLQRMLASGAKPKAHRLPTIPEEVRRGAARQGQHGSVAGHGLIRYLGNAPTARPDN